MPRKNEANLVLETHLRELGLNFTAEYKFCKERRWRFDYCIEADTPLQPCDLIAIEIEGGVHRFKNKRGQWIVGHHHHQKGFENDMAKYNQAAIDGFVVLRFSTKQVLTGEAKRFLKEWLKRA